MRSSRLNAYIAMIWLEWVAGVIVAAATFGYTMNWILPRHVCSLGLQAWLC
jgi:hypothetical protein